SLFPFSTLIASSQKTHVYIYRKGLSFCTYDYNFRYFNVIGSEPEGRLGEAPRAEPRECGCISGACFNVAQWIIPGLKFRGTDYKTADGTCIRDYIDVTDLVGARVLALANAKPGKVRIYYVGTGKGVKEFVEACKKATGVDIKVEYLSCRTYIVIQQK
ncbi:UDP-arabinose 4-epimerase 1-like, partial [Pistacia vera]|uniref:UDP-arabinose 4-epimerase 1-like n=1 Tax=Pistacia vera TaxID=55513 RepID=UPI001262D36C